MTNINDTLAERGKRYGEFKDHAAISQALKDVMRATEGLQRLTPSQRESLEMIAHKIARILNGNPNYADSWHDIAGYSKLVEDELVADGWIEWKGGECPVPQGTLVDIKLRDGRTVYDGNCGGFRWSHTGMTGDIIAYRIVK